MQQDFFTKTTNFKIFGITIFSKDTICKETMFKGDELKVYVSPDYYNSEFKLDKENKEGK